MILKVHPTSRADANQALFDGIVALMSLHSSASGAPAETLRVSAPCLCCCKDKPQVGLSFNGEGLTFEFDQDWGEVDHVSRMSALISMYLTLFSEWQDSVEADGDDARN